MRPNTPPQWYLREGIDYETLRGFVETLQVGREYTVEELWQAYNGGEDFANEPMVFRYAVYKVGMEEVLPRRRPRRIRRT